jgi:hypothetical protein
LLSSTEFTTEHLEAIARIQERDGISRTSAIRKYQRQLKAEEEATREAAKAPKQPKAKVAKPKNDAGKARSAGVQLFILAGRPTYREFQGAALGKRQTAAGKALPASEPTAQIERPGHCR